MQTTTNRTSTKGTTYTPTYGPSHAMRLRAIAAELFAHNRPAGIPDDIFSAAYKHRARLSRYILSLADEIESAPGPVEVELVAPNFTTLTVQESRDVLYLMRAGLV